MDEITANIDSETKSNILSVFMQESTQRISILITHDYSDIDWANKVLLLRGGKIDYIGDTEHFKNTYSKGALADLI